MEERPGGVAFYRLGTAHDGVRWTGSVASNGGVLLYREGFCALAHARAGSTGSAQGPNEAWNATS